LKRPIHDLYYFESMRTDETGSYTIVDSIYYEDNRKYTRFLRAIAVKECPTKLLTIKSFRNNDL